MNVEKVENWLKANQERLGIDFKQVYPVDSGESNHNFVIESDEKKVLRVTKTISRKSRLENEAEKLEFLADQGIEGVPEKIFFEKETELGEVLIESFVGTEKVDKNNLNEERIRSLATKIAEIHSIPVESYRNFSGSQEGKERSLKQIFKEDFVKWSERPYKEYRELSENVDERIEYFFGKQKELLKEIPDAKVKQGLCHGDLGFNIRATENEVFIIDWEFSRISHPGIEIIYCFEHEKLDNKQRKIFLEEYRKTRDTGNHFEFLRKVYPKFLAFNDMIWAAKRIEEGEDKKQLLEDRIKELEEYYR